MLWTKWTTNTLARIDSVTAMTYGGYVSWPDTSLGRNRRNKTLFLWVQQDNMAIILSDTAASWFMEYGWLQRKTMVEERAAGPNKMHNEMSKWW